MQDNFVLTSIVLTRDYRFMTMSVLFAIDCKTSRGK